jgi:hypothetical protein
MDNITHTVKEKMQKTYSFTGTQLLVTGLWVVILLSILACAGRGHGWPRGMMMKQYDRQWMQWQQKQDMMRWQSNDQGQPEPMMNNNQPTTNQEQPTPLSTTTDTGN